MTLDSLRSSRNHSYLIEELRNKLRSLKAVNWSIDFGWVKTHVGIYGNELADNLAKEAASSSSMVCYERIPKSAMINKFHEVSLMEWQSAVSYTHLDVYKRQVEDWGGHLCAIYPSGRVYSVIILLFKADDDIVLRLGCYDFRICYDVLT